MIIWAFAPQTAFLIYVWRAWGTVSIWDLWHWMIVAQCLAAIPLLLRAIIEPKLGWDDDWKR